MYQNSMESSLIISLQTGTRFALTCGTDLGVSFFEIELESSSRIGSKTRISRRNVKSDFRSKACRYDDKPTGSEFETINRILQVAAEYELCDVSFETSHQNTTFMLTFKKERSSIFVNEWVKFWMRPFDVEYKLKFEEEDNDTQGGGLTIINCRQAIAKNTLTT